MNSNDPEPPHNLAALVAAKFNSALANQKIFFVEGTTTYHPGTAFAYQTTIAPAFAKKPHALSAQLESAADGKEVTPFVKDSPDTIVTDIGPFQVVLNKYCAVRNQILLVTPSFKVQSEPLSGVELLAVYRTLETLPGCVAFFNCGEESGASQLHKHVQIVPLGTHGLFPDQIVSENSHEEPALMRHPKVPYAHFVFPMATTLTTSYLGSVYDTLLAATVSASTFKNAVLPPTLSYNFLMTSSWMMMIPRVKGNSKGVGVNALGMVGVIWVASDEELGKWTKAGCDEVLLGAGLPSNYI